MCEKSLGATERAERKTLTAWKWRGKINGASDEMSLQGRLLSVQFIYFMAALVIQLKCYDLIRHLSIQITFLLLEAIKPVPFSMLGCFFFLLFLLFNKEERD